MFWTLTTNVRIFSPVTLYIYITNIYLLYVENSAKIVIETDMSVQSYIWIQNKALYEQ